jgi:uncharacterized protein (DUF1697 family)
MPTTYIALLRGINVGKAKRVAMADLRQVIESLGYTNARTLLNSGNAVFSSSRSLRRSAAEELRESLLKKTGVSSRFILRSAAEFANTVAANPLVSKAHDPTRLFALFLAESTSARKVTSLLKQPWTPEAVASGPQAIYIWCPDGLLASKAMNAFGKALGDEVTVRNWATVLKLERLATTD